MLVIRPAAELDLPGIREIYNDAILYSTATFDTDPKTIEQMHVWLQQHVGQYPAIVAVENEQVLGWASLSRWSDRKAYDTTAEISFYVREGHRGKGIGKQLLEIITREGKTVGLRCILSRITEGNPVSVHLHESLGYSMIGTIQDAGKKFDSYLSVQMMQIVFK